MMLLRLAPVPVSRLSLIGLLGLGSLWAQQTEAPLSVRLSEVYTVPGQEVAIPLYLLSETPVEIAEITLEVLFPSDLFRFSRLERAFQGFGKTPGSFQAKVQTDSEQRTFVQIDISVKAEDEPLADGLLGYLVFHVSPEAPLGELDLETRNLSVRSMQQELVAAQTRGAKVKILSESDLFTAITSCFFYMH